MNFFKFKRLELILACRSFDLMLKFDNYQKPIEYFAN